MSTNKKPRNFLRTGFIAATGLAALAFALSSNDSKKVNSQEPGTQPRKLTYEQVETAVPIAPNVSPINFQEITPNPQNPQFPDKAYPTQSPSILTPISEQAPQPTSNPLRNIPMPPAIPEPPRDLHSQPVYQPAKSAPSVQLSNEYLEGQIHRFVSKLSLPESPWATVCIGRVKNPNAIERFFGKKQLFVITNCQSGHIQQQVGMDFVNYPHELRALAKIVSDIYQPAYTDPKACEKLAKHAGLDSDFVDRLEGTSEPTIYDRLAQFSFQYANSLSTDFPGVVYYQTSEGHKHATGNVKAIKQLKQRTR